LDWPTTEKFTPPRRADPCQTTAADRPDSAFCISVSDTESEPDR